LLTYIFYFSPTAPTANASIEIVACRPVTFNRPHILAYILGPWIAAISCTLASHISNCICRMSSLQWMVKGQLPHQM